MAVESRVTLESLFLLGCPCCQRRRASSTCKNGKPHDPADPSPQGLLHVGEQIPRHSQWLFLQVKPPDIFPT